MAQITFLGTGNALVTKCYNTCFVFRAQNSTLLVDAGGGNAVLAQLEKAGIPLASIHHLFLTHTHTDHILGCVWVIRVAMQMLNSCKYTGPLHVYSHSKGINSLRQICMLTLPDKVTKHFDTNVIFHTLEDQEVFLVENLDFQCFDIGSDKELQYGFRTTFSEQNKMQTLVCLGDEPYNENVRDMVENADWLLCEAFCLYAERDIHHPYEKYHSTVKDAAGLASRLNIRNLVLYHSVDADLFSRKTAFIAEAREFYEGNVYVPADLDTISL